MKRFVEGEDRSQSTLFPERLDDYIAEDNPVRVVDVFVDELNLKGLGFDGISAEATGRPAYHRATLLKIYVYGYLNRIQSSRRLERETQRNVELIWLTGRLMPDFKTIADLRKDNGKAIREVCREFVVLCRSLNLFSDAIVAIDGSKFKAVNNRDKNFTDRKLKARMQQLEESITCYLTELDRADRGPASVTERKISHLKDKLATVKTQMRRLKQIGQQMAKTSDGQISLTDPDARSMATSGRGTGIVGYNVQTAVDAKQAKGQLDKRDFRYIPTRNEYRGPADQRAVWRFTTVENGLKLHKYWSSACPRCPIKAQCTSGEYRRISRWEHEHVLDAMQARLDRKPEASRIRRQTVEHPFGTLKAWMGATHFLTRTLPRLSTEMSLQVLAYNLKRMIRIVGVVPLTRAIMN